MASVVGGALPAWMVDQDVARCRHAESSGIGVVDDEFCPGTGDVVDDAGDLDSPGAEFDGGADVESTDVERRPSEEGVSRLQPIDDRPVAGRRERGIGRGVDGDGVEWDRPGVGWFVDDGPVGEGRSCHVGLVSEDGRAVVDELE